MKKFSDLTLPQKLLEGLCLILLAAMFLFPLMKWRQLPLQIPAHFNAAGEVDRWGGRWELFLLPAVSVFMYGFLTFCNALLWKPIRQGALPLPFFYWLTGVKLTVLADFAVIEWYSVMGRSLPAWYLPVSLAAPGILLGGSFISSIRFIIRQVRK